MNLTEQQLTLLHSTMTLLLTMDGLRDFNEYDPNNFIRKYETILDREYYWALRLEEVSHGFGFIKIFRREVFDFLDNRPDHVQETFDILNMFKDHDEIREQFIGFDGNHDDHYSVYQFLVEVLNMYPEVSANAINSHITIIPTYRELLSAYGRETGKKISYN